MCKRAANAQEETTPGSELSSRKLQKRSSLDEKAQKSLTVITVDSLELASGALLTLEGASQDASREACASLEDGVSVGGPPNSDKVVGKAPSKTVFRPSFLARLANAGPRSPRLTDRLMLGSYVLP